MDRVTQETTIARQTGHIGRSEIDEHIDAYTCVRTHTITCINTYVQIGELVNKQNAYIYMYVLPYSTHTQVNKVQAYIHSYKQTNKQPYMCTGIHAKDHAHVPTYIITYIHTYVHTDIHAYIHASMHACIHT